MNRGRGQNLKFLSFAFTEQGVAMLNMTGIELALNILAEASATEISKTENPEGFNQSQNVALEGAKVAKDARKNLEQRTGKSIISPLNAKALPNRMENNDTPAKNYPRRKKNKVAITQMKSLLENNAIKKLK
ncbi:hypothetical protein [Niabella terrae]